MNAKIKSLLIQLFPPRCVSCYAFYGTDDFTPRFCPVCKEQIEEIKEPYCSVCGIPFFTEAGMSHTCPECLKSRPAYDSVVSVYEYGGPVRDAILNYKYKNRLENSLFFAHILIGKAYQFKDKHKIDFISPVPTHKFRLIKRGYDHISLLVYQMNKLGLNLPLFQFEKKKSTPPLWGKTKSERKAIVSGSYAVKSKSMLKGKNILLIDDIMTTGATINECAVVLKKAGANSVFGLTIAREII